MAQFLDGSRGATRYTEIVKILKRTVAKSDSACSARLLFNLKAAVEESQAND